MHTNRFAGPVRRDQLLQERVYYSERVFLPCQALVTESSASSLELYYYFILFFFYPPLGSFSLRRPCSYLLAFCLKFP